jgi:hopanoid biosynthesis associated protein HpnK
VILRQLIINADDFGLHKTINTGIIEGFQSGCITSTSIMPGGKAFEHAVSLACDNPGLGIGVHLTLVTECPISDLSQVKTLVDSNGYFPAQYPQFLWRYLLGQVCMKEIRLELEAQVQKVAATGIRITHLDSHQHMHIVPGILPIVVDIAKQFDIKAIRIPDEPYLFRGEFPFSLFRTIARSGLTFLARMARYHVKKQGLAVADYFFGMLAGGNMREQFLQNIITSLPDGISEVMMHPASNDKTLKDLYTWDYHWEAELAAVTSVSIRRCIEEKKVALISFRELGHG